MTVTNTDDHLRNHAFIYSPYGWRLSPMYDVNPVPYGDELSLLVDDTDNRISLELAVKSAPRYGISVEEAKNIADEVAGIVRENWERLARECGLSRGQIEGMRPAFTESEEK